MTYIPAEFVQDFFSKLNNSNIEYVLIKNISDELPDKLEDGKDIDILVNEKYIKDFKKFMNSNNFKEKTHPYGKKNGWVFGYKLPKHQFWKLKNKDFKFFIDVCFKLCCKSLTPNIWIPLDNCINEDIWKNKVFDDKNNWWIMDDETTLVYMFCRAVFDKKEFKKGYISEIEKRKILLDSESVKHKLSKVFFKYTDLLISQAKSCDYDEIVKNYIAFRDY